MYWSIFQQLLHVNSTLRKLLSSISWVAHTVFLIQTDCLCSLWWKWLIFVSHILEQINPLIEVISKYSLNFSCHLWNVCTWSESWDRKQFMCREQLIYSGWIAPLWISLNTSIQKMGSLIKQEPELFIIAQKRVSYSMHGSECETWISKRVRKTFSSSS